MQNGDNHRVINANGICIHAECEEGTVIYEECVPSTAKCTLPDYTNLDNGKTSNVHGVNGVCGEFTCTNGILDVRPCSTLEAHEDSFAGSMRKVGALMDRLDKYLDHEGFRRNDQNGNPEQLLGTAGQAPADYPVAGTGYKGSVLLFSQSLNTTYEVDIYLGFEENRHMVALTRGRASGSKDPEDDVEMHCPSIPYEMVGQSIDIVGDMHWEQWEKDCLLNIDLITYYGNQIEVVFDTQGQKDTSRWQGAIGMFTSHDFTVNLDKLQDAVPLGMQ